VSEFRLPGFPQVLREVGGDGAGALIFHFLGFARPWSDDNFASFFFVEIDVIRLPRGVLHSR